ncbi:hypothetical protein niasHS_015462 [Heterodera schachtii]|uniref:B30.2/SPRY domain-containing protein n=1 Tax=Heterodera schachtii TaxID=97005 RepID=A0ABD2HU64_HETSC
MSLDQLLISVRKIDVQANKVVMFVANCSFYSVAKKQMTTVISDGPMFVYKRFQEMYSILIIGDEQNVVVPISNSIKFTCDLSLLLLEHEGEDFAAILLDEAECKLVFDLCQILRKNGGNGGGAQMMRIMEKHVNAADADHPRLSSLSVSAAASSLPFAASLCSSNLSSSSSSLVGTVCRNKQFRSRNAFDNHLHQSCRHNEEVQLQQHEQKTTTEAAVFANACQTTERQNGGVEEKLSKITPQNIDNEMSTESDSGEDEAEAEQQQGDNGAKKDNGIPPNECLFCGHKSDIWEENVVHMIEQHGFRFPDSPFRTDVLGLLTYLGFKVGVGLTCVGCQCLRFRSLAALRKHMRDSNHCNFCFQSRHEEFLQNEVLLLKAKIVEVENEHNKLLKMLFNNFQQNFWDATACHMELKITGAKCLSVVFQSDMTGYRTVFAVHPILLKLAKFSDIFYYEISIKNMGNHILFGFGMKRMSEKKLCTRKGTYACSSDGTFWINGIRKKQEQAISCYGTDDVVGCGVNLATQQIFFTKNGHKIFSSNFPENIVDVPLFPCVSLCDDDDKITANFGHKFLFDLDDL